MKKILALIAVLMLAVSMASAQTPSTHIVDRGETLASIAKKYGVSEAEIISLNPEAAQFIYVGQELNLPTSAKISASNASGTSSDSVNKSNSNESSQQSSYDYENEDKPGFGPAFTLEYGFLSKEKGVKGTNYTYAFTAGANYYFMHKDRGLFAGLRIGYNSANYNSYVSYGHANYITQTSTAHFISVPVNLGYKLKMGGSKFALTPYAGLDVNFCVGAKSKSDGRYDGQSLKDERKIDKKVGLDCRFGLNMSIYDIGIGASYVLPINDNQKAYFGKDGYLAISIVVGL